MLTLDEVFRLADENSKSINIHSLMTDEAEKAIEIAKNDLLPSVGAKATAQYISDCVTFDRDFGNWESGEMIVEKEYAEEELQNSVHEACIGLDPIWRGYDVLMMVYPASWILTGILVCTAYYTTFRTEKFITDKSKK